MHAYFKITSSCRTPRTADFSSLPRTLRCTVCFVFSFFPLSIFSRRVVERRAVCVHGESGSYEKSYLCGGRVVKKNARFPRARYARKTFAYCFRGAAGRTGKKRLLRRTRPPRSADNTETPDSKITPRTSLKYDKTKKRSLERRRSGRSLYRPNPPLTVRVIVAYTLRPRYRDEILEFSFYDLFRFRNAPATRGRLNVFFFLFFFYRVDVVLRVSLAFVTTLTIASGVSRVVKDV